MKQIEIKTRMEDLERNKKVKKMKISILNSNNNYNRNDEFGSTRDIYYIQYIYLLYIFNIISVYRHVKSEVYTQCCCTESSTESVLNIQLSNCK